MSDSVKRLIRPEIQAIAAYHVPDASGMIKLDAMENPYSLPPALQQALGQQLQAAALNRYPDPGGQRVKQALASQIDLPAGYELLLGNGSDELIQMLMLACAKSGATVLAPEPSFVMYRMVATWCGLDYVGVDLQADFSLDMPMMLQAIEAHQPALTFLAYPNNPTGNLFAQEDLRAILAAADGWVVIDEAYAPFASHSCAQWLAEYPNLLLMRTLSKLGLAGLRLGYLAGPAACLAELDKVRMPYNINVLTQVSVACLLEHSHVFAQQAEEICVQRQWLLDKLAALGLQAVPSEANFVLLRCADQDQALAWFAALQAAGILVKCLAKAHDLLHNCLRITIGTPEENQAFIAALAQIRA